MSNNFALLLPEFLVTGLAFLVLSVDFFLREERKHLLGYLAAAGLMGILAFTLVYHWDRVDNLYDGLVHIDEYTLFFKAVFLVIGAVVILTSMDYLRRNQENAGEYYGILLFTIVGMMLMAASGELLTAYISLELLSFSLYVLVAYALGNAKSNEASIKYIIVGAFSSAILLYGISMVYSTLGVTKFLDISTALASNTARTPLPMSSSSTSAATLLPPVRNTLAIPIRPLPYSLMSTPSRHRNRM